MAKRSYETLYVIIPAYNEEDTIEEVLREWYKVIARIDREENFDASVGGTVWSDELLEDAVLKETGVSTDTLHAGSPRLVIINDGSKDSTQARVEAFAKAHPMVVLLNKENGGHGRAVHYGYDYALKHGADYIFQTDSDGQTNPDEFYDFWRMRHSCDCVIGWRNHREDGTSRVFVTNVLKFVVFLTFHVWVTDANTPFRLMTRRALSDALRAVPDWANLTNVDLSALFVKLGYHVKFKPITFRPRQGGVNSISMKKIWKIGFQALHEFTFCNSWAGQISREQKKQERESRR